MKPPVAPSLILVIALVITIALAGSASRALAQSHVYTNADLGKPLTADRPVVTAEELSALAARQFQPVPLYDGPYVLMASADPGGPQLPWPQPAYPDPALADGVWQDPSLLIASATPFGFGRGRAAQFALRRTLPVARSFAPASRTTSRARTSHARR